MMTQPGQSEPHVPVTREELFDVIDQRVVIECSNPHADRSEMVRQSAQRRKIIRRRVQSLYSSSNGGLDRRLGEAQVLGMGLRIIPSGVDI
ncbi:MULTISPECIES: hypothetical protein [unclassified Bradyrhizobium]|uniref:hypothetical protein n=1 Tax=unclassified Bradyrhizobium TaxID=2631580 RepID=UPI001029696D|nr:MULTISPECIES: hypothetical protein [unclassified Bradyrhizobium]TAI59814.1 hypothetical protein CWO89_44170 [Bradyrhizobium sp. Leo170]